MNFDKVYTQIACATTLMALVLMSLPGASSLQCYTCRGITNYDPNMCFQPTKENTIVQECQKNEVCEKRVTMVDRLQDVVDRGCTANSAGRTFWWTDEFQVYFCNNDRCNSALRPRVQMFTVVISVLIAVVSALTVFNRP